MKNNRKNKLSLSTQIVRSLDDKQLVGAAGGYFNPSYQEGPSCPRRHSCTLICYV